MCGVNKVFAPKSLPDRRFSLYMNAHGRDCVKRLLNVILGGVLVFLVLFAGMIFLLSHLASPSQSSSNPITVENAKKGTTAWQIPAGKAATIQIQAYANMRSVAHGQQLTFYVSTQQAGTPYTIHIYRMGWYRDQGGREIAGSGSLVGQAQGYFNEKQASLIDCTTCYVDTATGLTEARWKPSYSFNVTQDWTTGVYLAKLVDAHNMQTYVSFDVLGSTTSAYVVVTADTTYAAYNNWGGQSLYSYNSKPIPAVKVSFDRPSTQQYGSDQVLIFEADAIRWFEHQGYDISYISDIDLHTGAQALVSHKAYISLGHDEYWTKEMRDGVEYLRDHDVGLAFLEADDSYWQARLEPNSTGVANHTVVSYKVLTPKHNLARDPLYGQDNSRVTSQFRDPVVNRPENALLGEMFSGVVHGRHGFPWKVASSATTSSLMKDTDLTAGQAYGCILVGYEWDKVFNNGATPSGLQILSTSATINDTGQADTSNTTVYIAPSHAMVFDTGSVYWTSALDAYQFAPDPHCASTQQVVPGIQKLMQNVMAGLIVSH